MTTADRKEQLAAFLLIGLLLVLAFAIMGNKGMLSGFTTLEGADVMAGKDSYYLGEMVHLFTFPASSDYDLEVYGPDGKLYANSLNFPADKLGEYEVKATIKSDEGSKDVYTKFMVIEEEDEKKGEDEAEEATEEETDEADDISLSAAPVADESTPTNDSAAQADDTSAAAGALLSEEESAGKKGGGDKAKKKAQVIEEVGGMVKDDGDKDVGRKIEDDESYETFFDSVGIEGGYFRISLHHNSSSTLPVWIEGDTDADVEGSPARTNDTVNITVPLVDGRIPKFKLHVGYDSDVFEFGIEVINVQSYPSIGGNWTVRFTTAGKADLTITPAGETEFGEDIGFIELRCGNNVLDADYDGQRVYYPDYECSEEGYETSHVITRGEHNLLFRFGSAEAMAKNYASKTVCDSGCDYTLLVDCFTDINNSDADCAITQENRLYELNTDLSFYIPLSIAGAKAISIAAQNVTVNCNNSVIIGASKGSGIYVDAFNNITIGNCTLRDFNTSLFIFESNNSIYHNINISNSTVGMYLQNSSNSTYKDINIRNITTRGVWIMGPSSNNTFLGLSIMNCSEYNLFLGMSYVDCGRNSFESINVSNGASLFESYCNHTYIRNSYFSGYISSGVYGEDNGYLNIYNSTFTNALTTSASSISFYTAYSNITNNTFRNVDTAIKVLGMHSIVENNTIQNCTSPTFGCIDVSIAYNSTITGNIINYSASDGIYIIDGEGTPYDINITRNTISNITSGHYDIYVGAGENITIWLNSIYSKGISNSSTTKDVSYCNNGDGNFYASTITGAAIGWDDCGLINVTNPSAGNNYSNNLSINWTRQSSVNSLTYYLYYSDDSGTSWYGLGSTSDLNYQWYVGNLTQKSTYKVKIHANDGSYNSTDNRTGLFSVINNQWVCSDASRCEYTNITSALLGENNTGKNITLVDPNMAYNITTRGKYNLSIQGASEAALTLNGTNITINCNESEINGFNAGNGLYALGWSNITIVNCILKNYGVGINLTYVNYSSFKNINISNSTKAHVYMKGSYNSTLKDMKLYNSTDYGMMVYSSGNNTFINIRISNITKDAVLFNSTSERNAFDTMNITHANVSFYLSGDSNYTSISSSYASEASRALKAVSSYHIIFKNNVILGQIMHDRVIDTSTGSSNYTNNTIKNANISFWVEGDNNLLENNTLYNCSSPNMGCIVLTGGAANNTVKGNEINTTKGHGILLMPYSGASADGAPDWNNITRNMISGTATGYYDLMINASNTSVWKNGFYSKGVYDLGNRSSFCVDSYGNFYVDGLNKTYPEITLSDCGIANITGPSGGNTYKGSIMINWTRQSGPATVNYILYYLNESGNWTYISAESATNYTWNTRGLLNSTLSSIIVQVVPYDNRFNATRDNSSGTFTLTVNNNWVCSNSSYCEYTTLSDALMGQNNTAEVISFMDANTAYQMNNSLQYNISPPSLGVVLNISKPNITIDCNNALLMGAGRGYGIYSIGNDNLTIINCMLYNYTHGITLIRSVLNRLANITINTSKSTALNISNMNKSTIEYSEIFGSVASNIYMDKANNNTIKQVNLTNSSQYGLYLKASSGNKIYYLNSSANNYENIYLDSASDNNTIENCTFANSSMHNLYIAGDNNNITASVFTNISSGYFDLQLNTSATYNAIWLNNFYSRGINDSGSSTIFCVNNSGNYYNPNLSSTFRPIGSCGNLSQAYADKDGDGYYTIYDCNDGNALIYPRATEYCDDFDNDCDGSIDEGVCTAETFKSAGTGGSGGSSAAGGFAMTTYKTVNIQEQPEFLIASYEDVMFTVKSTEYRLKLNQVFEDSISLTITSAPQILLIYLNETKNVDVDGDGKTDIGITLTSITGAMAKLRIKEAVQEQQPEAQKPAEESAQGQEQPEQKPPGEEKPAQVSFMNKLTGGIKDMFRAVLSRFKSIFTVLTIMVVAGGLLSGFFYYRSVVGRVRPMEEYIESALQQGRSKESVRKELIESGWEEEIVESILELIHEIKDTENIKGANKAEGAKDAKEIKEVTDYAKKALASGFTKEQVREVLLKRGWSEEKVSRIIK